MIHVSGVGLLGAFVLHGLQRRGMPFSWDDVGEVSAWRASTGAIIPCEDRDAEAYAVGYRFWRDTATRWEVLQPFLEPVETLYVMANPPSRVTRKWVPVIAGSNRIWREALPGWQFDVNRFVEQTRSLFSSLRRDKPAQTRWVLRARGVRETLNTPTVVWGWRGAATVRPCPGSPLWGSGGLRPVIHFNDLARGFERYYFHPRAGTADVWWCGSEAVLQKAPLDAPSRAVRGFERYQETVRTRFAGLLEVEYREGLVQGWRAKPRVLHRGLTPFAYETVPGTFVAQPLYKSGVQCGPFWAEAIIGQMLERGAR